MSNSDETLGVIHPLTKKLCSLFDESGLDHDVQEVLIGSLNTYLNENMLLQGLPYSETVEALYALNDNRIYVVISMWNADHYDFYLMSSNQRLISDVSRPVLNFLKSTGRYEKQGLHAEIKKVEKVMKTVLFTIREEYTFTTRRATGTNLAEDIEYPSPDELKFFYECARKVAYASVEEGTKRLFKRNNLYLCSHCNKYHQGKPRQASTIELPEHIMMSRYKRVWRRYKKI